MASQTEPLRILHLTDPHLFADTAGVLRGTVTYDTLSRVLAHYREGNWVADRVAVTGDLVQDDSDQAYEHFKQQLGSLSLPVHCLPGNHDVRDRMQAALAEPPFYYCDATEAGNWLIVGLDSCDTGRAGGHVSSAELDRLDATIENSGADNVMVSLHHPPVQMGSAWLDTVGLDNGKELLARITKSGKVRLVIFGHVHQEHDSEHQGVRILATPSTCRQFKPGADDFAVDDLSPAYRRIELKRDGTFDTELIWVGNA